MPGYQQEIGRESSLPISRCDQAGSVHDEFRGWRRFRGSCALETRERTEEDRLRKTAGA